LLREDVRRETSQARSPLEKQHLGGDQRASAPKSPWGVSGKEGREITIPRDKTRKLGAKWGEEGFEIIAEKTRQGVIGTKNSH